MANCLVTTASAASNSAAKTLIEAVDEDKMLDAFVADGWVFAIAMN